MSRSSSVVTCPAPGYLDFLESPGDRRGKAPFILGGSGLEAQGGFRPQPPLSFREGKWTTPGRAASSPPIMAVPTSAPSRNDCPSVLRQERESSCYAYGSVYSEQSKRERGRGAFLLVLFSIRLGRVGMFIGFLPSPSQKKHHSSKMQESQ